MSTPYGRRDRYACDEVGNLLEHIRADSGLWLRDQDTRSHLARAIDGLAHHRLHL